MKLPPFEEFLSAMAAGEFDFEDYTIPVNLPEYPKHDQVVEYAKATGRLAALKVARQYHSWLVEHLSALEEKP